MREEDMKGAVLFLFGVEDQRMLEQPLRLFLLLNNAGNLDPE